MTARGLTVAGFVACALSLAGCAGDSVATPEFRSYFAGADTYQEYYDVAAKGEKPVVEERVIGGVVPHHLYVGPEFARYYSALERQKPSVIVVVGPNHFEEGRALAQTTRGSYVTPFGTVPGHARVVDKLVKAGVVAEESGAFVGEHSVSSEVAFLARHFPGTPMVPVILKSRVSRHQAEELGETLADILPSDALVLASVDFSHYLSEPVADFHDQTSRAALLAGDVDAIQGLEVDSPASLTALTVFLKERGAGKPLYEKHTNSASYGGNPSLAETTSHFFLAFGKGEFEARKTATVFMVGDTILDRSVKIRMDKLKTPDAVLDDIAGLESRFFYGSTVNFLNLEGPVTEYVTARDLPNKIYFRFEADDAKAILKRMRTTVAGTANNHINDSGKTGRDDTAAFLKVQGVASAGYPEPCAFSNGIDATVAICAFIGNAWADAERAVREAKEKADFVLVTLHWGVEYDTEPSEYQRVIARGFIDAGADAIVGHGPHVAQTVEVMNAVPVVYSLGDFLFDGYDPTKSSGLAAGVVFEQGTITLYLFPVDTLNARPRLLPFGRVAERMKTVVPGRTDAGLPGKYVIVQE